MTIAEGAGGRLHNLANFSQDSYLLKVKFSNRNKLRNLQFVHPHHEAYRSFSSENAVASRKYRPKEEVVEAIYELSYWGERQLLGWILRSKSISPLPRILHCEVHKQNRYVPAYWENDSVFKDAAGKIWFVELKISGRAERNLATKQLLTRARVMRRFQAEPVGLLSLIVDMAYQVSELEHQELQDDFLDVERLVIDKHPKDIIHKIVLRPDQLISSGNWQFDADQSAVYERAILESNYGCHVRQERRALKLEGIPREDWPQYLIAPESEERPQGNHLIESDSTPKTTLGDLFGDVFGSCGGES